MTTDSRNTITRKAGKILAVNPDPGIIRIIGVNLDHANCEFVSDGNGRKAIDKTFADTPDVIITGPSLPDIDLYEKPFDPQAMVLLIQDHLHQRRRSEKIRTRLSPLWEAVNVIPFLMTSLLFVRYIYNMYGDIGISTAQHTDIPPGAGILAVASTYERLLPGQAIFKTINDSAGELDLEILNRYTQPWSV